MRDEELRELAGRLTPRELRALLAAWLAANVGEVRSAALVARLGEEGPDAVLPVAG